MVKLKRLKIEKYRNVLPTELHFNDGLNVLLGQNGTGKTTLLKLIAMVLSPNFSALKETEFDIDYDLVTADFKITVKIQNVSSERNTKATDSPELMAMFGKPDESMAWSYEIKVTNKQSGISSSWSASSNKNAQSSTLRPEQEEVRADPFNTQFIFLSTFQILKKIQDQHIMKLFHETNDLFFRNVIRLDEGLGGFAAMTSSTPKPEPSDIENSEIRVIVRDDTSHGYPSNFTPQALAELVGMRTRENNSYITIKHTELEFFQKATKIMQFAGGELKVELLRKTVNEKRTMYMYGNFGFNIMMGDGSIISHQDLSYGQKRLLTFLYHSATFRNVIIADELVNGLHHEWIEFCLNEIGSRQSFLTSQNPLLLDFLVFETSTDVEHTFILCGVIKQVNQTSLVWSNLDPKDADRFYRAYKVGIEHVSEILKSKGLW